MHVLHQIDVSTSDHWRILQHTFRCAAGAMKSLRERSRDVLDVVKKWDCFLVCFEKILDILQNVRYYNNVKRSGKYSSDFVQNCAQKKEEYCCVMQMYGTEHTWCFQWFWSNAGIFQLFKVFSARLRHSYRANICDQMIENTTVVNVDVILSI